MYSEQRSKMRTLLLPAPAPDFRLPPDSRIQERDLKNIFLISRKIRLSRYVYRRLLPVWINGRIPGVLEQVYIHKQVYGAPKACLQRSSGTCKNKDYFVITTNGDHCFQKAGFFTLREITVFSCAAGLAIKQHMIMKKQSAS